jgi:hypothetical protein
VTHDGLQLDGRARSFACRYISNDLLHPIRIPSHTLPRSPTPIPSNPHLPLLNTDKPTLLPLLRRDPRPLENRIRTTHPNPLRRRRTRKMQHARLAKLRARSLERVANSEKDAAAHEKGGFACGCVSIDEMGDVDWVGGCEWRGGR